MIRMSKQADYGLVLMTEFLRGPGEAANLSARELARKTGLPVPMVSKVLKALAREGLLISHRGANGGYSLARTPQEISVAEVLAAVEGPIAMTECLEDEGDCRQQAICPVRTNWERINYALTSVLEAISLADMLDPLPDQLVTLSGVVDTIQRDRTVEAGSMRRN